MTEVMADNGTIKRHDIKSLCGEERDFLVRNNGDQVKVRDLEGKVICLYFSASCCGPCRLFTPKLVGAYDELSQKYSEFEVVFVSSDWDEESFCKYFSGMPWVAIPFADSATRKHLGELFTVTCIPHLVVLDKNGEVTNSEGVLALNKFGSEAYPFTQERIDLLNIDLEDAKRNQTLRSVLGSSSRDFLISNNGNKVPVLDLEGKIVGLFFSDGYYTSNRFTSSLVKIYKRLKDRGENFEVVIVPLDDEESSFQLRFATVPWLAIPFKDKSCERLDWYFELQNIPTLVVIGFDGKTLVPDAAELLEAYGDQAYPFSLQKMEELAKKEMERMKSPNLESLLVSWEGDYVIGNGDVKIPVSDLVSKNILLYFDARENPYYLDGFPELTEMYNKIKAKDTNFELIFISSDGEQAEFDIHLSSMPWLSIPFDHNERAKSVSKMLDIGSLPLLVAIGATGWTITKVDMEIIRYYGAEAYPFTEEHLKELVSQWPQRLLHPLHKEHVVVLTMDNIYSCEVCGEDGLGWCFTCDVQCFNPFNLHPKCTLKEDPNKDAVEIITAYPFSEERLEELDVAVEEEKQWPERLQHPLHKEHALVRTEGRVLYNCGGCRKGGDGWSFYCEDCDFNLHPKCALKEDPKKKEGFVCDGKEVPSKRPAIPKFRALELQHPLHREHVLVHTKRRVLYNCGGCREGGNGWSYYCKDCDFDLHPKCALKEDPNKEDCVCDGEVRSKRPCHSIV